MKEHACILPMRYSFPTRLRSLPLPSTMHVPMVPLPGDRVEVVHIYLFCRKSNLGCLLGSDRSSMH